MIIQLGRVARERENKVIIIWMNRPFNNSHSESLIIVVDFSDIHSIITQIINSKFHKNHMGEKDVLHFFALFRQQ